jgi:murein DD-endopeptidase MepM/ murein hydrolase activator NlpD
LASKKITIVFLPDRSHKVRQFKMPRSVFIFFGLVLLTGILSLAWMVRDYLRVKSQVPALANLQKENRSQKGQLASLAQKIDQISRKMIELKEFDHKLKVMVNLETDEEPSNFLGIGGSDPSILNPDYSVEEAHQKLVRLMHKSVDNLDTEIALQINEKVELSGFLEEQKSMLACTPSIWPAKGWVSSRFGYRTSPFTGKKEFHRGLDISARQDTPIIAPADGIVASAGKDYGYGNVLTLQHGHGLKSRYAHLSKMLVRQGQSVKRGQEIALMGNTGRTTGTHLHYEVHLNGVAVNPINYILN